MENVSEMFDYLIGAIRFGGFQPSDDQKRRLMEALQLETFEKDQKEEQLKVVGKRLRVALWLKEISTKSQQQRESSIKQIQGSLNRLQALEADTAVVEFLIEYSYYDAPEELRLAREKMEKLLRRLEEGETFSASGPVNGIHSHMRRLLSGTLL
jgi:hypothetical protein